MKNSNSFNDINRANIPAEPNELSPRNNCSYNKNNNHNANSINPSCNNNTNSSHNNYNGSSFNIQNNQNFNIKDTNQVKPSSENDFSSTSNAAHVGSGVNAKNIDYPNGVKSIDTIDNANGTGNININNNANSNANGYANGNANYNMNGNYNNNVSYKVNPNYNMHNKMMSNPKPIYNQYPLNMNASMNIYQNNDNLNNSIRVPMYPPQPNMLYSPMNYMNNKAYLKHLKYNKIITADPTINPNETLYVKNLNDRIKPEELKKNLKEMFKQYGVIKDIIVMKSFWRKGQAWIVYDTIESSTKALNALQGYVLHNKIMQINYSHNKSDIYSKRDGTFVERSKLPKKPKQIIEKELKQKEIFEKMHQSYLEMQMNNFKAIQNNENEKKNEKIDLNQMDKQTLIAKAQEKANEEKNRKNEDLTKNSMFSPYYPIGISPPSQTNVIIPYKILFIENVIENVNILAFNDLFKKFPGFIEARTIPQRNVAFVDFTDEGAAAYAMKALQNYKFQGSKLKISYAKR